MFTLCQHRQGTSASDTFKELVRIMTRNKDEYDINIPPDDVIWMESILLDGYTPTIEECARVYNRYQHRTPLIKAMAQLLGGKR